MRAAGRAEDRHGCCHINAHLDAVVGDVDRIGIKSTGSYGAGLLRYTQKTGIGVVEVKTPDTLDRRRRGKNDDLDA